MPSRRKVRSDAKLEQLSSSQHAQLIRWLDAENCSYTEAVARIHREFGLSVGRTAVVGYYRRRVVPLHQECGLKSAAAFADLPEGRFDAATVKMAKWLAWSAISQPTPQLKTASALLNLVHRASRQAIAARRMELQERRVALREKESARRARRQSRSATAAQPEPSTPASQTPPCVPSSTAAPATVPAHENKPHPATEPQRPVTLHPRTPSQKTQPNPPLYSPYFGLSRAHRRPETTPLSSPKAEPSELTIPPPNFSILHEIAEPLAA